MSQIPCSERPCSTDELCAAHEEEEAHTAGEHEYCGVTCETAFPTEQLYNWVSLTSFDAGTPIRVLKLVAGVRAGQPVDEKLRERIIANSRPGTRGALKELIRRVQAYDPPICPWIPSEGVPSCDFDPECPVHGVQECPEHGTTCDADSHAEPPTVRGEVV